MADGARLESFRLTDSFPPVGTYTASYSLEQFVQKELISNADDLRALLSAYLEQQVGPYELVALRATHAAARNGGFDAVYRADRRLTAATLSRGFRKGARQSGSHLLSLQRELRESPFLDEYAETVDTGDAIEDYAVVLGVAAAGADIDASRACLLCCHGFVTGFVGATQRVFPLGHTDAQWILHDLRPVMTEAAANNVNRRIDEMSPFTPLIDVLSVNHERADRRLFMS